MRVQDRCACACACEHAGIQTAMSVHSLCGAHSWGKCASLSCLYAGVADVFVFTAQHARTRTRTHGRLGRLACCTAMFSIRTEHLYYYASVAAAAAAAVVVLQPTADAVDDVVVSPQVGMLRVLRAHKHHKLFLNSSPVRRSFCASYNSSGALTPMLAKHSGLRWAVHACTFFRRLMSL